MEWILYIIYALIVIMLLVVLHEFGHFIVGYKSGIKINEFSVGFGPKIVSKVKNGIKYSLRWLPLGGYVQFHGEDEEIENDPLAFNNAPIWKRFLTILAGPMMNIIVAIIFAIVVLSCYGDYDVYVGVIQEGSAVAQTGIMEGDHIIGVNGEGFDFYSEFYLDADEALNDDTITLDVERDGEEYSFTFEVAQNEQGQRGIPLGLQYERHRFGFFEAIGMSVKWIFLFLAQMFKVLFESVKNLDASQLSGFVGTSQVIGQTFATGNFENIFRMASLLSLNLGIVNLLPFPALDGGRLVFIIIEKLRGKPVKRSIEGMVNFVGLVLLFGLMILLTYQDLVRIFTG